MTEHEIDMQDLLRVMLKAYGWGMIVHNEARTLKSADEIKELPHPLPDDLADEIGKILSDVSGGVNNLTAIDELVDKHDDLEDLREYLVDLMLLSMIHHGGEEFLDSPQWEGVEEGTEDRGTELLNVLVYLRDCQVSETKPELTDFLNEFLLVDDDEYQDEFFIYEEMIKNQGLLDGSLKHIVAAGNSQRDPLMAELFTPLMLFFREAETQPGHIMLKLLNESRLPELQASIYAGLCHFWHKGA